MQAKKGSQSRAGAHPLLGKHHQCGRAVRLLKRLRCITGDDAALVALFAIVSLSAGATAHPEDPRSGVVVVMGRLPSLVTVDGCRFITDIASEQSNDSLGG